MDLGFLLFSFSSIEKLFSTRFGSCRVSDEVAHLLLLPFAFPPSFHFIYNFISAFLNPFSFFCVVVIILLNERICPEPTAPLLSGRVCLNWHQIDDRLQKPMSDARGKLA